MPQITKLLIPKPSNFIPNRRMSWTCVLLDGKTTKLSSPRSLLVLLGCCGCMFFFLPIQASTGSANMSLMISWLPWGNQKIGSAKKAWWLRGKRWVTPRHMSFWNLEDFIRGCLIFGTFYGGKFSNAVTYKFVFWNLWNLVNPSINLWMWHTKSIGLICLSFGCWWI